MSVIEGGRFDFDDGGSYVGEWCDGRAHGLGVATGPENQGEYSGEWVMGFESRGVYIWPSGNIYCGGWMKGKRHGEGVQLKGKWTYKGEFSAGFCGRYGVKESHGSVAKYEGSWHLNLFDGFGIETSGDGSIYAGNWAKGLRHGLGVRKSAPFYAALSQKDPCSVRAATSQSSLLSANDSSDRGGVSSPTGSGIPPNTESGFDGTTTTRRSNDHHRSGFVLISSSNPTGDPNTKEKKSSFRKTLFRKLRKQKSTGDLRSTRMGGSLRSTISTNSAVSHATNHSLPDTLQVQTREIIDPNTTEIYWGQWKDDKRSGYGIAERSDGLRYEGEWYNNKKDGYGVTIFANGTREEGRYKENVLVQALHKRNKLFAIRHSRLRDSVEEAIKHANDQMIDAKDRVMEIAYQRSQTARNSAESAEMKAREAQMLSNHARDASKELAPDFVQLGVMWLKSRCKIDSQLGETLPPLLQNSTLVMDTARYCAGSGGPYGPGGPRKQIQQSQQHNQKVETQQQLQSNYLNPDQECLEVSGGSRRGSFRSSFRRSGDKKSNFVKNSPASSPNKSQLNANLDNNIHSIPVPTSSAHSYLSNNPTPPQPIINEPIIKSQYSTANQLSANPITMSSSKPPGQFISLQPAPSGNIKNTPIKQSNQLVYSSTIEKAPSVTQFTAKIIENPTKSHFQTSAQSNQDHYEHYAPPSHNQYPPSIQVPYGNSAQHYNYNNTESYNTNHNYTQYQPKVEDEFTTTPRANTTHQRRRSVPSIMTAKPVGNTAPINNGGGVNNSSSTRQDHLLLEDATKSSEFLNSTTSVYIIENGIRKRVEADNARPRQPPPLSPKSSRLLGRKRNIPVNMIEPEADELAPLPRNYRIESNLHLRKKMEGSLPDVTMCDEIKNNAGTLMTRQEASQLSQQRRQELLREQERLKRGEIIIRMSDLKDWLKQNYVLVLILLLNFLAGALFLHIMKK